MSFLIAEYKLELGEVDEEMRKAYSSIEIYGKPELFNVKAKELTEFLEKMTRDFILGKEKKFLRDQNSYTQENAYRWTQSAPGRQRNFGQSLPKSTQDQDGRVSDSSMSSNHIF